MKILHHGAVNGVTGSCHELRLNDQRSILIECGLFKGDETLGKGVNINPQEIDFDISLGRYSCVYRSCGANSLLIRGRFQWPHLLQ